MKQIKETQKNTKFIPEPNMQILAASHNWVCTDNDYFQYRRRCRDVDGPVFELAQIIKVPSGDAEEYFLVSHAHIYLADYDESEISDILAAYGLDPAVTEESIIAECLFEVDALESTESKKHLTKTAALERIEAIIGQPIESQ